METPLTSSISLLVTEGTELNGMGQMMSQYLEQNLADFPYKVEQALGIRCCVSVEVERGIACTIHFEGPTIRFDNGVFAGADLHLKSAYQTLAKLLTGQIHPMSAIVTGRIKFSRMPRRPFQALKVFKFLKIPTELLISPATATRKNHPVWGLGMTLAAILVIALMLRFC